MIVLSGADLVLPDRILPSATLVVDRGRIADIRPDTGGPLHRHYIVPGFIDVHIHGIAGVDVLGPFGSVAAVAGRLPRYGVTAFCPTAVACPPRPLQGFLAQVQQLREEPIAGGARVLPAHLESNFINPAFRGAQPADCLRMPCDAFDRSARRVVPANRADCVDHLSFSAAEILSEIERSAADVGIVTLAPELEGGLDLTSWLVARGIKVSLGHSAATLEETQAAVSAGARLATHLFNRMAPFHHRAPGIVGAVLQSEEVAAELICDGVHVHPAAIRAAMLAKGRSRILAITDATSGAGLADGARARLGEAAITVRESAAYLDDGTLAGSTATMDGVFRTLVGVAGISLVDAATVSSTTPARELGLVGYGLIAKDAVADLAVLDWNLSVVQTYVGGSLVWSAE